MHDTHEVPSSSLGSPTSRAQGLSPWVFLLHQQGPPASTRKNASMSASVPVSPSPLKSALPQVSQQLPARHAKKASISASVPVSPSPLKSALPQGENVIKRDG